MEKINKICINCPAGCHLEITAGGSGINVSGNRCPRGIKYAETELTDPRRVVTAAVLVNNDEHRCIPVKSTSPVPFAKIPALLEKLRSMRLDPAVKRGDIILSEIDGFKVDIIATGE